MNQVVPLTSAPRQTFAVSLNVDGAVLRLRLSIAFSEMAQYWLMSIADGAGHLLVSSLPMLTGDWPAANLLAQHGYLGIGSAYVVNAGQVPDDYPTARTLGTDFLLLWGDTAT